MSVRLPIDSHSPWVFYFASLFTIQMDHFGLNHSVLLPHFSLDATHYRSTPPLFRGLLWTHFIDKKHTITTLLMMNIKGSH